MAWVKVDDQFPHHTKVIRAADELGGGAKNRGRVLAVWLDAMAYCNRCLTDGFIPQAVAKSLADAKPLDVLKAMSIGDERVAPIVDGVELGWQVRNYTEYQPSKAETERKRSESDARKEAWRERRKNAQGTQKERVPDANGTRRERDAALPPTRPDPTRTRPEEQEVQTKGTVQAGPEEPVQSARAVPSLREFDDYRQHLKAAAYAYLSEHPEGDDTGMAKAVRTAAAALHLYDFTGKKINGIVYEVRGYLAKAERDVAVSA